MEKHIQAEEYTKMGDNAFDGAKDFDFDDFVCSQSNVSCQAAS